MRSALRIAALSLVLLALLVPVAAFASDGPCPDDPELSKDCNQEAPPYYVVINRAVEYLYPDRPGTGCQPIILKYPDCKDCVSAECTPAGGGPDVEAEVCQFLPPPDPGEIHVVYEMCCACAANPDGDWLFRIRLLDDTGSCPIDPDNPDWIEGLPPGTGIDLPVPVIVGGLALLGAGLLAAGVVVRRRTVKAV
jgi:hypothetical protein